MLLIFFIFYLFGSTGFSFSNSRGFTYLVKTILFLATITTLFLFFFSHSVELRGESVFGSIVLPNMVTYPFLFVFILVTPVTLIYSFKYKVDELHIFTIFIFFIFFIGINLFIVDSALFFFFLYEALLIPSFLILYWFAKTRKSVEASFLMFFWTQFGALFLISIFQYFYLITGSWYFTDYTYLFFSDLEISFVFFSLLVGFGVKFPIWPFYEWLPQAHVEASTNFSIFLSGVLVKFAFFGFFKLLLIFGLDFTPLWFYPFILLGFLDSSSKLYYQVDLKKVIAFSTVIEMHWLTLAVVNGSSFFFFATFAMLISHALLSSNFFLIIDSVTRRFKTRLTSEISGIAYYLPNLYFVTITTLVIFLGFPGTLFFLSEVFFFSALLDFNVFLFFIFFLFAYFIVPSCYFKSWFLLLFGSSFVSKSVLVSDLNRFEILVLSLFIFFLFWLGFSFPL